MKYLILLAGLILTGSFENAQAALFRGGGQVGNGGDAVVCTSNYKLKAELLDVFEGRILHKLNINFQASMSITGTDTYQLVQAKAHRLAKRIEHVSPLVAKRYHEYINSFFEETNFVSGVELVDIPDSNGIIIPVDCKIAQLVIQISDGSYGSKRYIINQDIWNLLDDQNKAAALFHEVVYRAAIETGQEDSRWTRYFNAIVMSDRISTMTGQQFADLRRQAYVDHFSYKGFELAGKMNPKQNLYQVLSAPTTETLGLKLDDGIYDMEKDFLIEGQFSGATTQFKGLTFSQGLGVSFGARGVADMLYFSEFKETSSGIQLIPPSAEKCKFSEFPYKFLDFCQVMRFKWDPHTNEFQVQENGPKMPNKAVISFSNNVQIIFEINKVISFAESMTRENILSNFCSSNVCLDIVVVYAKGLLGGVGYPIELNEAEVKFNADKFLSYSSKYGQIVLTYKIPSSFKGDLDLVKRSFTIDEVKFNDRGDYSFIFNIYSGTVIRKMVKKDGSIIDLVDGDHEFTFDKDGYLLSVIPK